MFTKTLRLARFLLMLASSLYSVFEESNCLVDRHQRITPGLSANPSLPDYGRVARLRTESCWNDCLKEEPQNRRTIRPCVPSHVACVCELQAVEDDCLTGGENDRSDLVSHGQYARCYGGAATIRLKRTDNESRNRKVSIGTARSRSLCQHQGGVGLASILW